jgi:hypothetical protein
MNFLRLISVEYFAGAGILDNPKHGGKIGIRDLQNIQRITCGKNTGKSGNRLLSV